MVAPIILREAGAGDVDSIAALATLVFLDTYAPEGLQPHLAREALAVYSTRAFEARLADTGTSFVLAEVLAHVVGFVELTRDRPCPDGIPARVEVVRLYVHPRFHRAGIGTTLLKRAEHLAGPAGVWLSAWVGNTKALAFYADLGYKIAGKMAHVIEGKPYENHILVRHPVSNEPKEWIR